MAKRKDARSPSPTRVRSGLVWVVGAERLRTAKARGGVYALVGDGMAYWTAQWRPTGGKVEYLMMRVAESAARAAAERHFVERQSDELLGREGGEVLNQRELAGAATTWKHRR